MSGTRSRSPKARAISAPALVLVSHGVGGTAGVAARHARALGRLMPNRTVIAACLFGEPSLERVLDSLEGGPCDLVPMLMADGHTMTILRSRLAAYPQAWLASPLGDYPGLVALIVAKADAQCEAEGWRTADTRLLLAAHGSPRHPASARAARRHTQACSAVGRFHDVSPGFLDQSPRLGAGLRKSHGRPCVVVGLFIDEGPHGRADVMRALDEASDPIAYAGAIGADERIVSLIARIYAERGRDAA